MPFSPKYLNFFKWPSNSNPGIPFTALVTQGL
jgi:hypothetical protein